MTAASLRACVGVGLVAGLVATVAMRTVLTLAGADGPPARRLVERVASDDRVPGFSIHVLYGVAGGGAFGGAVSLVAAPAAVVATAGVWYGTLLMAGGLACWVRFALGTAVDWSALGRTVGSHAVYGVALGGGVTATLVAA